MPYTSIFSKLVQQNHNEKHVREIHNLKLEETRN